MSRGDNRMHDTSPDLSGQSTNWVADDDDDDEVAAPPPPPPPQQCHR